MGRNAPLRVPQEWILLYRTQCLMKFREQPDTRGCAMLVGYARTSTTDQKAGLDAQERDLRVASRSAKLQKE